MADQNYLNNNIGLLPTNKDNMNRNQLQNNPNIQLNSFNEVSPYVETNLNINNLILLNSNNQIKNDININNRFQNNYYNNSNNNYYHSGNNIKIIKPYLSNKNMLIVSESLTKANDLIYKDLQQLENILGNYKYYLLNNNYNAIDICLKYILENNFFFNQVVTNKIEDMIKNIFFSKDNNDETFKYKLKEILRKIIPFSIKESYLREYFKSKSEKYLYSLIKKDLNIFKNNKDKIYYLYEIYENIKYRLNNKDNEEIKSLFNKYFYSFKNQNFNNNNYKNNNYYNNFSQNKNGGNYSNNNSYNNNNKYRKHSFQPQNNNWNEPNYNITNKNNYINGNNNNNYHSNHNHNYIEDKNKEE